MYFLPIADPFVLCLLQADSGSHLQLQESDSNSSLLQKIMTPANPDYDSSSLKRSKSFDYQLYVVGWNFKKQNNNIQLRFRPFLFDIHISMGIFL